MDVPQPERPHVPDSFGVGLDQYPFTPTTWEWVTERLSESRNYWVVTARPDGRPHSVPVWGVWSEDAFHFATDPKSVTARNLESNPSAVINLESGDDVVILEGRLQLNDGSKAVRDAFQQKYDLPWGADEQIPVFTLTLSKALAWTESDFPSNATRWRFDNT